MPFGGLVGGGGRLGGEGGGRDFYSGAGFRTDPERCNHLSHYPWIYHAAALTTCVIGQDQGSYLGFEHPRHHRRPGALTHLSYLCASHHSRVHSPKSASNARAGAAEESEKKGWRQPAVIDSATKPVRRIARQHFDQQRHEDRADRFPVRMTCGAKGMVCGEWERMFRDIFLTPLIRLAGKSREKWWGWREIDLGCEG